MNSDAVNHVKSFIGHFGFSPFRGIHLRDGFIPQDTFHDTYSVDGGTLGEGGFGKVFSAVRNDNGVQVDVKFVKVRPNQRFQQISNENLSLPMEMYLHSEVSNIEGVVTLYDYYERADAYLIVMERVERVQELLKFYLERGRLEECLAKEIFVQVVKIVLEVTAAGVFHRDLKSENILIAPHSLSVTLIDFGCAAKVEESPFLNRYSGTLDYAPPEWFLHSEFGGMEATTWSLGVLLYEKVVGKVPFRKPDEIVANRDLSFPPGTSSKCQNLILDCLRSRPHKRLLLQEILDHVWCLPGSGFDHDISRREVTPATSQSTENSDLTNTQNTDYETNKHVVKIESLLSSSSPIMRSSEQIWHLWEAAIPSADLDSVSNSATEQSHEIANNNAKTLDALLADEQEPESHRMETTVVSFLADLLRSARAVDQQPAAQLSTPGPPPNHWPESQSSPQPPFNPHRELEQQLLVVIL